jgi:hypothetical protein
MPDWSEIRARVVKVVWALRPQDGGSPNIAAMVEEAADHICTAYFQTWNQQPLVSKAETERRLEEIAGAADRLTDLLGKLGRPGITALLSCEDPRPHEPAMPSVGGAHAPDLGSAIDGLGWLARAARDVRGAGRTSKGPSQDPQVMSVAVLAARIYFEFVGKRPTTYTAKPAAGKAPWFVDFIAELFEAMALPIESPESLARAAIASWKQNLEAEP